MTTQLLSAELLYTAKAIGFVFLKIHLFGSMNMF